MTYVTYASVRTRANERTTEVTANRVNRSELSPLGFLRRSAAVYPDRVAVVHGSRRTTYGELASRAGRFAASVRAAGLSVGDRVAILSPNTPAMLEAHFGVPEAGCVLVAINTRLVADEVGYILHHSGARLLLVDDELWPTVEGTDLKGIEVVRISDTGEANDPYEAWLASSPEAALGYELSDENEPISINYTSGTTGRPKGVVYTHRGAYLNALGEVIETGLDNRSVYLWTLPMFHCNGWCFTWAVTAVGGRHVCLRKVDPGLVWDLIESEGVTHLNGAPAVQSSIVNDARAHPLEREITVTVAGAPPSPTLLARLKELRFRPIHVYGLTETYGPHTVCAWHPEWDELTVDEQAALSARQGQAYATAELVRVVDEDMQDASPGDMGEVVMRGNNVMAGYFEQPEATEQAFRGGWFHSGDLGVRHDDGYVELRDRAKDIIISGGENISTIEVEQVIMRHPAVLDVAVIAIPDERWGERPKAFVVLRPDEAIEGSDIIAFCRDQLPHFKCPDAVEFGELPRTSTGKVQKFVLREREWAGRDRKIN